MRKIIVVSSTLKAAMKTAMKVVDKRSPLPVLEYFKCEVKVAEGRASLTLTSTDLVNHIGVTINCEAKEEFTFLLHSQELKLIEKLEEQPITIHVDEKAFTAQLITEDETVSILSDNHEDFPCLPEGDLKKLGYVTNEFLSELKTCLNYVSDDDLRPAFTGVNFKVDSGKIVLCGTDAHMLRTTTLDSELTKESEGESFIMHPEFCKLISSVKNVDEMQIGLIKNENASFTVFNYSVGRYMKVDVISKNIDVKYCDYNSVIPITHSTSVTI